jgi:hypothetical protein
VGRALPVRPEVPSFGAKSTLGMFASLYRHDGWGIGLVRAPVDAALLGAMPRVEWIPLATPDAFAADPFLIEEDGRLYCFFEQLPYATNRGKIAYAVLEPRPAGAPVVRDAIVEPFHLSYPFMLRHEGEILCIPEAGESGRVAAYAARNFPDGWYLKHVLIDDFPAIDPTIFRHDGRWWMLATDARAGWNDALHVWYADELFGRWQPHACNPVKTGLSGTRPAGRPFSVRESLYRPAQDCAIRYGGRLIVNEILKLTPDAYEERAVNAIAPDPSGPYADGMHTANGSGNFTVVDGNKLHFVRQLAVRAIVQKMSTLKASLARSPHA